MRALLLLATISSLPIPLAACSDSRERPLPAADGGRDARAGSSTVDPVTFCTDRQSWSCQRRWAKGELSDAERSECLAAVEDLCAGATWASDCASPPTPAEAEACIEALSDPMLLDTPEEELTACQRETLCSE